MNRKLEEIILMIKLQQELRRKRNCFCVGDLLSPKVGKEEEEGSQDLHGGVLKTTYEMACTQEEKEIPGRGNKVRKCEKQEKGELYQGIQNIFNFLTLGMTKGEKVEKKPIK